MICPAVLQSLAPYPPQIRGIFGGKMKTWKRAFPSTPFRIIQIRNIKSRDKPYNLRDFEGLLVLFKIIGSKFRRFKCRPDGNEGLLVIGGYPAVSLAQACKTHDLAKALMADGIDPNEAKTRPSCTTNTVKNRTVSRECSAGSKIN